MTDVTSSGIDSSSTGTSDLKQELSGDAQRLKDTAAHRAEQEADAQKGKATSAAHSTSSALEKAAEELRNDANAPSWLSSAFETTAKEIDRFASGLENKNAGDIRRDVTEFARRSPTAFLAASAAAGFAAARFLRAGSEYQSHNRGNDDASYAQGRDTTYGLGATSGGVTGGAAQGQSPGGSYQSTSREGALA